MTGWRPDADRTGRWRRQSLFVGAVLSAFALGGAFLWPGPFFRGSLVGFLFWSSLSIGCLAWLMLQYLTGGDWGLLIRRFLEAGASILPVCVVFFLPVALGMEHIYPWTDPEALGPVASKKLHFLDVPFFLGRSAFYFLVWLSLAWLLVRWSHRQDETGDEALLARFQKASGPGMIVHGLVITLASVDWAMSLEPAWFSTGYGVVFGAGQALTALCFCVLLMRAFENEPPFDEKLTTKPVHDLGNLMLATVMFYTYVAFAQYLIIWSGNLPEETTYYLHRMRGGWFWIAVVLLVLHFFVPFLLLLSRTVKDSLKMLAAIAGGLLVMRFIDTLWSVLPAFEDRGPTLHVMDFLVPAAMGGLWLGAYAWRLEKRPLLPPRDPATAGLGEEEDHHA